MHTWGLEYLGALNTELQDQAFCDFGNLKTVYCQTCDLGLNPTRGTVLSVISQRHPFGKHTFHSRPRLELSFKVV